MAKYVILSLTFNTFVPDTEWWEADAWTKDLNKAKVFESFEEAVEGLSKVGCSYFGPTIYEVREVKSLSLGSPVHIDDKDTVLRLLEEIADPGVVNLSPVADMNRIINYIKAKGT